MTSLFGLMALTVVPSADSSRTPAVNTSPNESSQVQLRGRVVCLTEEKQPGSRTALPVRHEHAWGFKTADGKLYSLRRTRFSEAIFLDESVRARELVLKARVSPDRQEIDVSTIHSIRNGVEHDLYYYCDVCSIQLVAPEICVCCQGPVRLVEKPLSDKSDTVPEK
jgi:hypothetical protein